MDNSNSILLLFLLLAFSLLSFSSLPPFLPPLLRSLQIMLITLYQNHGTALWRSARTESSLIFPLLSHVCVCIMIRIESHIYGSSFLLFTYISCLVVCLILGLGHIRFGCLDVCFIILGWSYLLWIQIRKIAKKVLIKNRLEIRLKFYKKLVTFMKNCADR